MPLIVGGALAVGGLVGKSLTKTPKFNPVGHITGDYSYQANTDYGQGTAQENMQRYGFQGVYQKFLTDQTEQLKKDEMSRILKLTSNLVPGQASLRGGVASQGLNGATSNVIAKQQREQGMTKAMDAADQTFEASSARLDNNLFQATTQNEGMRFGASQDLMKATGMGTEAVNTASRFNKDISFRKDVTNNQIDQFNTMGEFNEGKAESDKWQGIFGDVAGIGASVAGMGVAKGLKTGDWGTFGKSGTPLPNSENGIPSFSNSFGVNDNGMMDHNGNGNNFGNYSRGFKMPDFFYQ